MDTTLAFVLIILLATILQTSTGFGFSIMATPFLLLIFAPREAIQINLFLSLLISCVMIVKVRKDVNTKILKRLIVGSATGLPIGILIFLNMDMRLLKINISVLILLLTILLMINLRMKQLPWRDTLVGGISGLLTTSIGMPGPPLLLYFSGTNMSKAALRATTLAFYLFIYAVSLAIQIGFAGTSREVQSSLIIGIPISLVGIYLGQLLFKWINQETFRMLTYLLLFIAGGYLLLQQF
ncbi:MAG TPA: sulfite exporter TauE/SafE family protein [Virgibacillus sp.]|nr:sulfite exporter TauE/SafE family protein [Virgibacillus sp.]